MSRATLSTHVLDIARGRPAAGVGVALYRESVAVALAVTDADGRVRQLGEGLEPGTYELRFDLAAYDGAAFFENVALTVRIGEGHHHVPLLVSAHGAFAYRGS